MQFRLTFRVTKIQKDELQLTTRKDGRCLRVTDSLGFVVEIDPPSLFVVFLHARLVLPTDARVPSLFLFVKSLINIVGLPAYVFKINEFVWVAPFLFISNRIGGLLLSVVNCSRLGYVG